MIMLQYIFVDVFLQGFSTFFRMPSARFSVSLLRLTAETELEHCKLPHESMEEKSSKNVARY